MATLTLLTGTVLGVGHGAAPAVAGAGPVAIGAVNAGWFDATGFHAEWNTSYGVGPTGQEAFHGGRIRNFFVFDLSGLTGQVVSAELSAPSYGGHGGPAVLTLYDVSTPPATLGPTVEGAIQVFDDLGSGATYGAVTVADPMASMITVPLSTTGVTALQAGVGRTFAMGGDYAPGETTRHSLFHQSEDHPPSDVRLLVTLAPASTTTVSVAPTTTATPTTVPRPGAATTVTSPPTARAAAPKATALTTAATRAFPSTTAGSPTTTETTATTATTAATPPTSTVHSGGRVVLAGSSGEDGAGAGGIAVGGFLVLGAFLLLRWKFT